MFGISYETAIVIVGAAMIAYVLFGGMIATTWVQIVKAVLLLGGAPLLAVLVLSRFGFNPPRCSPPPPSATATACWRPGKLVANPLDAVSLGHGADVRHRRAAAHPDALLHRARRARPRARRCSTRPASSASFYLMTFVLGFGAMVLVGPDAIRAVDAGGNMAAPLLAELLAARRSSASSRRSRSRRSSRSSRGSRSRARRRSRTISGSTSCGAARPTPASSSAWRALATVVLGVVAVVLGITFKGQNVAFMVSLAFAIAASGNFPALVLSIFWRRCTTAGAVASMVIGTACSRWC